MARDVVDPSGVRWRVGRQWTPWRVRIRAERPDWTSRDGGGGDWLGPLDDAGAIVVALGLLVALALLFLVVCPVIVLALELVLVALLVLVGVVGRVVLRRPWTVHAVARGNRDHRHEWHVVGWRASGALIEEAAEALQAGRELPQGAGTYGTPPEPVPKVGSRAA